VREEFYAVVLVGIVGGGDNHAGLKVILAHQAGYAGRGDDSRKSDGAAGQPQSRGKKCGDVRAGFAGIHADEHVGGRMLPQQISAEGAAGGEERGVIERRSAGDTANSVRSEEFFGHESLAGKS
jgi:hypothetical protein